MKTVDWRALLCVLFLLLVALVRADRTSLFATESELDSFDDTNTNNNDYTTDQLAAHDFIDSDGQHNEFEGQFGVDQLMFDENNDVQFTPNSLMFRDCPLSITAAKVFELHNTMTSPVIIYSIRSSNNQLHSTLNTQTEVDGGESITINILYLPYRVETIVAELTILTSRGEYRFPITANAVLNPYRVNPQLGIRFPTGGSILEKPIIVYNPHKETLHITEIFTTEPFLTLKDAAHSTYRQQQRLEQSAAQQGGSGGGNTINGQRNHNTLQGQAAQLPELADYSDGTWSIPPGSEKEVIVLAVSTDLRPGQYSGFLHIKSNFHNLVMPVELSILSTLVYPQHEELFFGTLTSQTDRKTLDLWVKNNGPTAVEVTEIIPVEPDENLLIELAALPIVYASNHASSRVAKLTYLGKRVGNISNKLLVVTNNTNAASAVFEVRYSATVLHGGVGFEQSQTQFYFEIYNHSWSAECSHCDTHGHSGGFDWTEADDLLSARLQRLQQRAAGTAGAEGLASVVGDRSDQLVHREIKLINHYDAMVALTDARLTNCQDIMYTDYAPPTPQQVTYPGHNQGVVVDYLHPWKPINVYLRKALVYALYREDSGYLPRTCHLDVTTNVTSNRVPLQLLTGALSIDYMDVPMIEEFEPYNLSPADNVISATTTTTSTTTTADKRGPSEIPTVSPGQRRRDKESDFGVTDTVVDHAATSDHSSTGALDLRCEGNLCQDSLRNDDVYHIELGNQSISEPKTLHIVLSNHNPVQIPMRVAATSHDVCMCTESLWPVSSDDAALVERTLNSVRRRTWGDSREDGDRCVCLAPTLTAPISPANQQKSKGGKVTVRAALVPPQVVSDTRNYVTDINHHTLFSLALRDLTTCRVFPTKIPDFTSVALTQCHTATNSTDHDAVTTSTGGDAANGSQLANDERSTVRVELHTPHQRLQLHLHFRAKVARLRTRIAPPGIDRSQGGQFVMGLAHPLTLRTRSSFQEPLRDLKLSVQPNKIYGLEYDHGVVSNPSSKSWYTGVHVANVCADRENMLPPAHRPANESFLRSQSLWRCSYQVLLESNFTDPLNSSLMAALRRQEGFMTKGASVSPQAAFDAALRLKQTWVTSFPHGLPLPPATVYMDAAQTTHTHRIDNATLQSPHMFTPHSYAVQLPTARIGQVQWFYLYVHNPFELNVQFSLPDDVDSETTKRMNALGGLFFSPGNLESTVTPRRTPAASRYQCMGMVLGEKTRISRTPIPCECRSVDIKRLNETFCEVDLSGPVELSGTVDDATVQRSRTLSLVQNAVSFASSDAMLAGLNKLFTADVDSPAASATTSEGAISGSSTATAAKKGKNENTNSATYKNAAFLPQSTVGSLWNVPPHATARIGPFLYAPRTPTPADAPEKTTFYIYNNFTGYDRVDVYTSSGAARLTLAEVAMCKHGANNTCPLEGHSHVWKSQSFTRLATGSASEAVKVTVTDVGQTYRAGLKNSGSVAATVLDISIDGVSCATTPAATTPGLLGYLRSLFPFWDATTKVENLAGPCAALPFELEPEMTLAVWARGPSSCDFAGITRQVIIKLDQSIIGGDSDGSAVPNQLVLDIQLEMSPELQAQCLFQPSHSWGRTALWVLAAAVLTLVLWQMLALYLLTKQQYAKYTAAKQAKGKRTRSHKRGAGSGNTDASPGGTAMSPTMSAATHLAATAGALRTAVLTAPAPTGDADDAGFDLSDILGPAANQDGQPEAADEHGSWSEVRPKLTAVEALLASRQQTKLPSPARTPPKLRVNTDFSIPDRSPESPSQLVSSAAVAAAGQRSDFAVTHLQAVVSPPKAGATPKLGAPPGFGFSSGQTSAETESAAAALAAAVDVVEDDLGRITSESSQEGTQQTESPALSSASSSEALLAEASGSAVRDQSTTVGGAGEVAAAKLTKERRKGKGTTAVASTEDSSAAPQGIAAVAATEPTRKTKEPKGTKKGTTAAATSNPESREQASAPTVRMVAEKPKQKSSSKAQPNLIAASLTPPLPTATVSPEARSPLRLQVPTAAGGTAHTSMSDDSPLFRYSGQLLDPTRESSAELQALGGGQTPLPGLGLSTSFMPAFPAGVASAAVSGSGGVRGLGSLTQDVPPLGGDASLLPDALSKDFDALWPLKDDALTLDIGLDLGLPPPEPERSPQDILAAVPGSELRVNANPFFSSMHYDSVGSRSRLRSDSFNSAGRPRDDSIGGGGYLHDLLATAQSAAHTALDTSDLVGSYEERREWFPSTGRPQRAAPAAPGLQTGGLYDSVGSSQATIRDVQHGNPYAGRWAGDTSAGHGDGHHLQRDQYRPQPLHQQPHQQAAFAAESTRSTGLHDYFATDRRAGSAYPAPYNETGPDPLRPTGPFFERVDRNNRLDRQHSAEADVFGRNARLQPSVDPRLQDTRSAGVGPRQHSAPLQHNQAYPPRTGAPLSGHSFDYLDDRHTEDEAFSWVRNLTQHGETEHRFPHRGGSVAPAHALTTGGAPGMTRSQDAADYRYQQPTGRDFGRGSQSGYVQRSPQLAPQSQPGAAPLQQYRPGDHPRHQRHAPSYASPQQLQHQPHQHGAVHRDPPYGAGLQHDDHRHRDSPAGYNPFARPDLPLQRLGGLASSPERPDTVHDRWLALNSGGGGALPALRSGPGANAMDSPQSRPVALGTPQYAPEFPSPEADAVAAELQFFHPNSFFGEPALGGLALEPLEGDELGDGSGGDGGF